MYAREFKRIGKRLFDEHLIGGNFGNISMRKSDEGFFIKRTGTFLDEPGEPVFVLMEGEAPEDVSSEFRVHRAVYKTNVCEAIIHAHPPYSVAASLTLSKVVPKDSEGKMFCPVIPVFRGRPGSDGLAKSVAAGLKCAPVVIARGHGTFAAGKTLDEAYIYTSLAEHACKVLALLGHYSR
jgi:L-fuculose-phosphate aldolase